MKKEDEVIENANDERTEMAEAEDTVLDEVAETLEENVTEDKNVEEEIQENEETLSEESDEATLNETEDVEDIDPHIENLKKNDAARMLVKKAHIIVDEAENQLEQCKILLADDLKEYESAKQKLKENGMEDCEILLDELGYQGEEVVELDENMVVFVPKEELKPIAIHDVSSGGFTGVLLALVVGFATLVGMVYVATEKLGVTLDVSKLPTMGSLNPIMKWYASLVGINSNPLAGGAIMIVVVLLVMWIVYKIRVSIRANSNLRMAKDQLAAAEEYSMHKGNCKEEMDKVDAYINDAIETLKTYQVILNEQKGKLQRIMHLEHDKIESSDFHHKSNIEMSDTQELISVIKDFMSVPMSEEGKLSGKSSLFLHRAKSKIQKVIDRLY